MSEYGKHIEQFNNDGYVLVRRFLDPELLEYFKVTVESYIKHLVQLEGLNVKSNWAHDGFIALDKKRQEDKSGVDRIHQLYNMVRRSDALARIVYDRKLSQLVKTLIGLDGDEMYYVRTLFSRMDPPKNDNHLLNWHQESFITIPNTRSAQLWAPAIGRNWEGNGSMRVLKGSAADGEIPHYIEQVSPVYITHGVPQDKIEKYSKYEDVTVDMEPTDVLLFHPHLLHRSRSNPGDKVRYSLIGHYINPNDKGFHIVDDAKMTRYHQGRCVNAKDFQEFLNAPKAAIY